MQDDDNVTLSQLFFKQFASKNQLPGSSISGTLVENGLSTNRNDRSGSTVILLLRRLL